MKGSWKSCERNPQKENNLRKRGTNDRTTTPKQWDFYDLTKKRKISLEERRKNWRKKTFALKLQWSSGPLRFFFWLNSVSGEGKTMKNIIFAATYISHMFCNPKSINTYNIKTLLKLGDWISCNSQRPLTHLKCCKQLHFYQITSFGFFCKLMLLFSITYAAKMIQLQELSISSTVLKSCPVCMHSFAYLVMHKTKWDDRQISYIFVYLIRTPPNALILEIRFWKEIELSLLPRLVAPLLNISAKIIFFQESTAI